MSKNDFDDFFKDLDPDEDYLSDPKKEEENANLSDFFEDEPKKTQAHTGSGDAREDSFFDEDDLFMPPPPSDEEDEEVPVEKAVPVQSEVKKEEKEEPKETPVKKTKKKSSRRNTLVNWLLTIVWTSIVLAIAVFIATFALSSINDLVGFNKESRETEVVIPENASLGEIAAILKEQGVIDEPFTFEVYARVKKMENRLYAGTYTLNTNLGYDQIFQMLRAKEYVIETVKVTLYEGMTATEIAKKLDENGVCGYDDFMEVVNSAEFDYEFATMMGTDPHIYHKWEGYIFPDSYEFYLDMKPRSVLAKFVENFNNKITASYYERMRELGMNLDEVITLASVIQSEAATTEDMHLVSSAFHNRLANGSGLPYLQSDVTYFYYQNEIEPYVIDNEEEDEAYHTSYDTYYKKGLPVGPICNPGLDAIEAALNPPDTDYYYFVTDVNGKFYYASTLAEHEYNVAIADSVKAEN